MKSILGIHHITAIAGDPQQNIDFYAGVLGLRLVKVTVNFDDPKAYHFYYGDGHGRPGTILTFFSWPGARRGRTGNGQVTAASFAVPKNSLNFWNERLATSGFDSESLPERFGERVLSFADPDGLRLELVETRGIDAAHVWEGSSVPPQFAIHGFHGATLSEAAYERTAALLTETMGFRLLGQEQSRFRYEPMHSDTGGPGRTLDVVCAPALLEGRIAVGAIHHINVPNSGRRSTR
jgi:glyoxalase family protein